MAGKGRFFELLASQVAAGKSVRDGAAEVGCSEKQGYRISGTAEFRSRVCEIRTDALSAAAGQITASVCLAIQKLTDLLDDPHHSLGAAKAILQHVGPVSELGELRSRLDKLEADRK